MRETFKAVEWMRQVRAEIDAEDAGLGWRDKHRKTVELLKNNPLWQKLCARTADLRAERREAR